MNSVRVVTLDGRRAAAAVREQWTLARADREQVYAAAREAGAGLVQLATCYRTEFYVDGDPAFLRTALGHLRPHLDAGVFETRAGVSALDHLMRVAAGLESAVLGEVQVLGQLRRAWMDARAAGALTPTLRVAFEHALGTGRAVRARTALGRGAASVASAAVMLAQRAAVGVKGRRIVVVGAGEMGRLLLKHLPDAHPAEIALVSRTGTSKAARVARPEHLPALLAAADVVFTATTRPVLTASDVGSREDRPLTLVDVGLPRNIDPDVDALPGVTRFDVDAVVRVVDQGRRLREAAVPEAEALVSEGLTDLCNALDAQQHEEVVRDLRRKAERIRVESVAHVCGKCSTQMCRSTAEGGEGRCSDPDYFSRTLTNRLLHDLTGALRRHQDLDPEALRRVLGLTPDA